MNPAILKRIKKIDNNAAVNQFFELLNKLIRDLNISAEDERLVLNVRNDYRKRFSVSINSRLVLGIREGADICFMLSNGSYHNIIKDITPAGTEDFHEASDAKLVWFPFEVTKKGVDYDYIKGQWISTIKEYLPKQKRSPYRKHHIAELYDMALDNVKLSAYLDTKQSDESNSTLHRLLIAAYKDHIKITELKDELYKWQLVRDYKGCPRTDTENFTEEVNELKYGNLIYGIGGGVLRHLAKDAPEELRAQFKNLFDEEIELQDRVESFKNETLELYRKIAPEHKDVQHHQDERSIATYLAIYDIEKYSFYKNSFYRAYCKFLSIKPKNAPNCYVHYLELLEDFIDGYVAKDNELLRLKSVFLNELADIDSNHYLLAQDILYQSFDKLAKNKKPKYWRVGTKDSEKSYWETMRSNEVVSIGWHDIGDLSGQDISGKEDIAKLFDDAGYSYDNRVKSRKSGEIWDFYDQLKIGDRILAQDGQSVLGIGIVTGQYIFQEKYDFPHTRNITWLDSEYLNVNTEGNQTTVFPIKNKKTIKSIEDIINKKEIMPNKVDANMTTTLNTILYGPPGTGKTYNTICKALAIVEEKPLSSYTQATRQKDLKRYKEYVANGQIVFTTFHQSLSYEDFIEGIKPNEPEQEGESISYSVQDGIFKKLCIASATPNQSDFNEAYSKLISDIGEDKLGLKTTTGKDFEVEVNRNGNLRLYTGGHQHPNGTLTKENIQNFIAGSGPEYDWKGYFDGVAIHLRDKYNYSNKESKSSSNEFVLIIDEINRGNVSAIFGELITLLESDKRLGNKEALKVMLPYSKSAFGVPNNLHVIGTMNTADRSVEALDSALRRRFSFEELRSKPELLAEIDPKATDIESVDLVKLLTAINDRIELVLDKDHQIGHSYFIGIDSVAELRVAFVNKVFPLLEEYFFGDFGKIGLIVGGDFIEELANSNKVKLAGNFNYEDKSYFKEKKMYKYTDTKSWDSEAFKGVYNEKD